MAFDFPDAPVLDETTTTPDGVVYTWDGVKWTAEAAGGAYVPLDGTIPMTGGLEIALPLAHNGLGLTIDGVANTDNPATLAFLTDAGGWYFQSNQLVSVGGNIPGSMAIVDSRNSANRFVIEQHTGAIVPPPVTINGDGDLAIRNILSFAGTPKLFPNVPGPWLGTNDSGITLRLPDHPLAFFILEDSASKDLLTFSLNSAGSTFKVLAKLLVAGDPAALDNDATLSLNVGAERWDLINQAAGSSIPNALTIAQSGNRRFNILFDPTFTVPPVEIDATGQLLLVADPTSPMGAVTKQYADAITAGTGAYVPLDGTIPMTGQLTIDTTVASTNSAVTLYTAAGWWQLCHFDAGTLAPGAFALSEDRGTRLRIDRADPAAPLPPSPVVITLDGSLSAANLLFEIGTTGAIDDPASAGVFSRRGLNSALYLKSPAQYGDIYFVNSAGDGYDGITMDPTTGDASLNINNVNAARSISLSYTAEKDLAATAPAGIRAYTQDLLSFTASVAGDANSWDYYLWAAGQHTPNFAYPAIIIGHSFLGPKVGQNSYHANAHVFTARDGLTEYAKIDGTGMTVLGQPIGGSGLVNWSVTEAGSVPGAYTVVDTVNAEERFIIEPYVSGLLHPSPMTLGTDGTLTILHDIRLSAASSLYPDPNIGPFIHSDISYGLMLRGTTGVVFSVDDRTSLGTFRKDTVTGDPELYVGESGMFNGILSVPKIRLQLNGITMDGGSDGFNRLFSIWNGDQSGTESAIRFQIVGAAAASALTPAGGINYHNAGAHVFRSYDTLTEYARIDGSGMTVGGVPVGTGGGATVSDTAPPNPTNGQFWFDSASTRLCMWYNDGTSAQWLTV